MLREYATSTTLQEAVSAIKNIQQKPQETETQFTARFKDAAYRCGNVHDEIDRMNFFINGISGKIRPAVEELRDETPRGQLTFAMLVQKARREGTMYRARNPNVRFNRTEVSGKKLLYLPEANEESSSGNAEHLMLIPESDHTEDLPTTLDGEDTQHLLFAQPRHAPPAPIPYGDKKVLNRPGWTDRSLKTLLICHYCYVIGDHIAPQCTLTLANYYKVILNYEKLTPEQRARIPSTSYDAAVSYFKAKEAAKDEATARRSNDGYINNSVPSDDKPGPKN